MKKLLFVLILGFGMATHAQQIYAEGGWTISSFDFINNEGETLENLQSKTQNYFGAGYRGPFFVKNLSFNAGLTYNSYGATGSDPVRNNFFDWDVDYLGIGFALDYTIFSIQDLDVFIKGGASTEWILNGTQRINNQVFDITKTEEFNDIAYFLRAGAGATYPISDRSKLLLQYSYGRSLALDNNNNSQVTELKIDTHMIGVGIMIDVSSKDTSEENPEEDTMESEDNNSTK